MKFTEPSLNEIERLKALQDLSILDTFPERCYDNLVELAAQVCETPIAAISLVDVDRTWSKSVVGLSDDQRNCPRDFSFCAVSIKSETSIFQIPDATKDDYFAGSPLVVQDPKIKFYAAANLKTSSGHTVGTLCVLDKVPRELTKTQLETLRALGDQAMLILETRAQLNKSQSEISKLIANSSSASEAYLRATLNSIDAGFVGVDVSGVVTICNNVAMKKLGFDNANEFVGKGFRETIKLVQEDGLSFDDSRHPVLHALRTGETVHDEAHLIGPKGNLVPIEYWVTPTYLNGTLHGAVLSLIDITERRSRELALAREQYLLDQIFKNSPAAMATWIGQDLVFTRVNSRYQAIFPGRKLIGRQLLEACPDLIGQGFDDKLREVMRTGQSWSAPEVLVKIAPAVGEPTVDKFFNVSYHPVYDENGEVGAVYNHSVEVTDAVVAKQNLEIARATAEAANAAKSQFLANISHEIRTPLAAVIGFADVLSAEEGTPDERGRLFERIRTNGKQLTNLIDDLLDLTKVEANQIGIVKDEFDLLTALTDLKELFSISASERNIDLKFNVQSRLPRFVVSDEKRIRQILVNLIGNAIKFTPPYGAVELQVSGSVHESSAQFVFRVIDTGPGISEERAAKLFQPFGQGDVSVTRKFGGSGLGLFVSRRLARLLDGDVKIESSVEGKGSVFKFVTKTALGRDRTTFESFETTVVPARQVEKTKAELSGIRILVVDDAPDNRELLRNYLTRMGATLAFAENGRAGIDKAFAEDFDIVLMDIQMPVLDGNSAMIELKKRGYGIPVLALTAHAMVEERENSLKLGFSGYLTKPISRDALVSTIKSFVRGSN